MIFKKKFIPSQWSLRYALTTTLLKQKRTYVWPNGRPSWLLLSSSPWCLQLLSIDQSDRFPVATGEGDDTYVSVNPSTSRWPKKEPKQRHSFLQPIESRQMAYQINDRKPQESIHIFRTHMSRLMSCYKCNYRCLDANHRTWLPNTD